MGAMIGGGVAAGIFFGFSAFAIGLEKYAVGLVFGIVELLSATLSFSGWVCLLRESGKILHCLLGGFLIYPPIGPIFLAMFVVGVLCARANIRGLLQQGKPADTEQA